MTKRVCSFCGIKLSSSNRAKEHVIPEWLLNLLELRHDEKHIGSRKLPSGEVIAERSFGAREIKYGLVCAGCNGGWLSALEVVVKEIFSRLFTMKPLSLGKEDCSSLAIWAYKTAILLALTADQDRKSLIRPKALSELYETRELPKTADVGLLLAIPSPNKKAETIIHAPEFIDQGPFSSSRDHFGQLVNESLGYATMLQFGHVVLRIINIDPRHRWKILDMNSAPQLRLGTITESTSFAWPPRVWLGKKLYDLAAGIKFSLRGI